MNRSLLMSIIRFLKNCVFFLTDRIKQNKTKLKLKIIRFRVQSSIQEPFFPSLRTQTYFRRRESRQPEIRLRSQAIFPRTNFESHLEFTRYSPERVRRSGYEINWQLDKDTSALTDLFVIFSRQRANDLLDLHFISVCHALFAASNHRLVKHFVCDCILV